MKTHILIITFLLALFVGCSRESDTSDAYGTFEADEVLVSAQTNGQLVYSIAEDGMQVKKGEIIAIVDTSALVLSKEMLQAKTDATQTRISQIDAQVAVQKQQIANLRIDQERVKKLIPNGAATQKQLDDINGAMALLNKQVDATLSQKSSVLAEMKALDVQMRQVSDNIEKCYIKNPLNGVILSKLALKGEIVAFGKPVYTIADISTLDLKVFISGAQLPEVKLNQKVKVWIDDGVKENKQLEGELVWISENAEFTPKIIQTKEERVKLVYAIKIRVVNDGSLKIGMPGEVTFQ